MANEEKNYGPEEEPKEKEEKQEVKPEKPKVLKDPNTGQPLRDQNPGVPDSKWVGKHGVADVDNQDITERKAKRKLEEDFGE